METIPLEPVDGLTVTTLVDNVADLLLTDQGPAKRYGLAQAVEPGVPAQFLAGGMTGDPLRAEHGFSCLVTIGDVRVLFDAGLTPDGLVENMRRLDLSPGDIDVIVLSHGHWDHTTGMDGIVKRLGRANVPGADPSRLLEPPPGRDPRRGRSSCPPPARPRSRVRASRSSRSGSRRSCSTGRCWSRARSTARPSSKRGTRCSRPIATATGSPTR